MNIERMKLLSTMLGEVVAGTWKPTTPVDLSSEDGDENPVEVAFDIGTWLRKDGMSVGCGFSACAIGHACLDDRFNEMGFMFKGTLPYYVREGGHGWQWDSDWAAVSEFFDLSEDLANHIFFEDNYPSRPDAQMVKDRVDRHIDGNV